MISDVVQNSILAAISPAKTELDELDARGLRSIFDTFLVQQFL